MAYTGDLDGEITTTVNTVNGTATAGEDFEAITNEVLTFSSSVTVQEIKVRILGDTEIEADETFTLELTNASGATISKGSATITINDDDSDGGPIYIPGVGYTSADNYPGMTLLWADEFEGTSVNESDWTFEIGNGSNGWGNQELEFYRKENASIESGNLVITAKEENFSSFNYTSTRMITKGKFDFKFGRVDIRAVMPYGQGIWPALWMLGADISQVSWPRCGEIDIMEMVGGAGDNTTHGTIHFANANNDHQYTGGAKSLSSGKLADEFHVYSIIWTENDIKWLLDDVQFHTESLAPAERSELKNNNFFIFNVAVGGQWPGSPDATTVFPQRMIVDYVRVFQ
jgi:beta-glucanase (GH16 family)